MSHRPTRLPRYAAKSVAPLDPAALVIGTVADVAAGLMVEWVPDTRDGTESARVEGFDMWIDDAGCWEVHRGNHSIKRGSASLTEAKRAAVLALAAHLRDLALKAIPLAQSGAGAAAKPFCKGLCYPDDPCTPEKPCPSGGHHRDVPKALTDAVEQAGKPTPAEVAKARGIRVGDRVRYKGSSGSHDGRVQAVTASMCYVIREAGDALYPAPWQAPPDGVELLPAEAPAFEWVRGVTDREWQEVLIGGSVRLRVAPIGTYLVCWYRFDGREFSCAVERGRASSIEEAKQAAEAAFLAATKPPPYEIG